MFSVDDIFKSSPSLDPQRSVKMVVELIVSASMGKYLHYDSRLDHRARMLAERYINNHAWTLWNDEPVYNPSPLHVIKYSSKDTDAIMDGIIYSNGAVLVFDNKIVRLFLNPETAKEYNYPEPIIETPNE